MEKKDAKSTKDTKSTKSEVNKVTQDLIMFNYSNLSEGTQILLDLIYGNRYVYEKDDDPQRRAVADLLVMNSWDVGNSREYAARMGIMLPQTSYRSKVKDGELFYNVMHKYLTLQRNGGAEISVNEAIIMSIEDYTNKVNIFTDERGYFNRTDHIVKKYYK